MGYIRSNQDWCESQGDYRSPAQRAADMRRDVREDKHMPDSVRERLLQEAEANEREAEEERQRCAGNGL